MARGVGRLVYPVLYCRIVSGNGSTSSSADAISDPRMRRLIPHDSGARHGGDDPYLGCFQVSNFHNHISNLEGP